MPGSVFRQNLGSELGRWGKPLSMTFLMCPFPLRFLELLTEGLVWEDSTSHLSEMLTEGGGVAQGLPTC
jgi:hypothetical protein